MSSDFNNPKELLEAYDKGFVGAECDPEDLKNLLAEMKNPLFGAAAYHLEFSGEGKLSLPFKSLLKFDPGFGPAERQTTGDSLAKNSKVYMADGTVKCVQDVQVGDYVLTCNGKYKKVLKTFKHPAKYDLVRFKILKGLYCGALTGNHEVIVDFNDGNPIFKQIKDLNIGDKILMPKTYVSTNINKTFDMVDYCQQTPITEDLDFKKLRLEPVAKGKIRVKNGRKTINRYITLCSKLAWLIGLYLAEGGVDGNYSDLERITYNLGSHEKDLALQVKKYFKEIFDIDAKIYQVPSKPTVIYVRVNSNIIASFFKSICPGNVYTKSISNIFSNLSKECGISLIKGWLDGDGHKTQHDSQIGCSASKNLIKSLYEIATSFDIYPSVYFREKNIDKNGVTHQECYCLYFDQENSNKLNDHSSYNEESNNFVKIEEIQVLENTIGEEVYCIEVEDDHHFIADGFGVSNCVSHAVRNAIDVTRAVEIDINGEAESFEHRGATEGIYQSRSHRGQGMSCSGAARYVNSQGGILIRKDYGDVDLSTYNSSLGARKRIPRSVFIDEAQKHQVQTVSLITTIEEARDALANGYGLACCSGVGFESRRDNNGISRRKGSWAHAMAWIACDDTRELYDETLFLIQNSWGKWNSGPKRHGQPDGSFWVRERDARAILNARGSFVFSNVDGFPARELPNYGLGSWA